MFFSFLNVLGHLYLYSWLLPVMAFSQHNPILGSNQDKPEWLDYFVAWSSPSPIPHMNVRSSSVRDLIWIWLSSQLLHSLWDLRQVTQCYWASFSPFVKWGADFLQGLPCSESSTVPCLEAQCLGACCSRSDFFTCSVGQAASHSLVRVTSATASFLAKAASLSSHPTSPFFYFHVLCQFHALFY